MCKQDIESILGERKSVHGDIAQQARIVRALKAVFYKHANSDTLSDVQLECLDMIFHKISRVGAGNANYLDHWVDIAGYATLVTKDLESQNQA